MIPPAPDPIVDALPVRPVFLAPESLERLWGRPVRVRMGANENAFGVSPRAVAAMAEAAPHGHHYGDPDAGALRDALSDRLGVSREHLMVGAGIDDLLAYAFRCFLARGVTVSSAGCYPMCPYHVEGFGGRYVTVPYRDDRNDVEALLAAARREDARILYLANPDNPSGSWLSRDELDALVDGLPDRCLLILDEAYVEFANDACRLPIDPGEPRVIRLRTFSKLHGMAGVRVGYAIAAPGILEAIEKVRLHFAVGRVAQAGALAALEDVDFQRMVLRETSRGRDQLGRLAVDFGLRALPSRTNFVAFDCETPARAEAIASALADGAVFVRMPWGPPLDRCIRVTVGTPEDCAAFGVELASAIAAVDDAGPGTAAR